MLLTILPTSAFSTDDLKTKLGITSEDVIVTETSSENKERLSEAAQDRAFVCVIPTKKERIAKNGNENNNPKLRQSKYRITAR